MQWSAKIITHRNEKRIAVYFEKNTELVARIKQLDGARWSQTLKVWHLPDTDENRIRFIQELLGHNDIKTTLIYTEVSDKSIRKIISPLDTL